MTEKLHKNLRLYPWYVGLFHAYFWLPVYFLFFNSKLDLSDVLYLASIYFASVVVVEVPSGWFSDTFGRKKTLVTASCFLCVAYGLFIFADSFWHFAIAQMFLAAGIAFNSGSDTSFLLETTQALDNEEVYGPCEAKAMKFNFLGTASAAVLGGLAAIPDYRGAYILSLAGGIGLLVITLNFKEPLQNKKGNRANFVKQIFSCFGLLSNVRLLWLSVFAVFMIVINHIPYEFYQPYIEELAKEYNVIKLTPFLSSVHLTLTMLVASWIAARSIRIKNKIGTGATLLSAASLQIVMMAIMHLFVSIPAAIATLLRSCPRALMTAPLNVAVAPNVPASKRATFLSLQSLFGRLGYSATLAFFASQAGGTEWPAIATMLGWGMWGGLAGFVILLISIRCLSKQ
jgi:MFS family permease|tara:strand:+ start:20 stop:1219 length:1200 start_codon:yes stop_codon:yes gene_type:complete